MMQSEAADVRTAPETVGLSTTRLARIGPALMREVGAGQIPGAVVGIARGGQLAYLEGVGYRDPASKAPMMADALFSIASMTKPMVSVAVMQLIEEGLMLLADPVAKHLPELADLTVLVRDASGRATEDVTRPVRQPTIQDLLRHTSGFTYEGRGDTLAHRKSPGSSLQASIQFTREAFLSRLAAAPLLFEPGSTWEYGFSSDVLGLVLERITGQSLGTILSERIWQPLGMTDTGFAVTPEQRPRYALALPNDPISGDPQSIHHAGGASTQWESGGGGAVSTAADYLKFLDMLRGLGASQNGTDPSGAGVRLLSRKSVELMVADQLDPTRPSRIADTMDPAAEGYGFGYGFAVRRQAGIAALHGSPRDYYWSGVYGTYFWVDPIEDLTVVFMAAAPGSIRLRYRQLSRALCYQAIDD